MVWRGLLHRYGDRLNVSRAVRPVTLFEGNTPLIRAPRLAEKLAPGCDLYLKYEGMNPTGSFKDRGMTGAITQALADGSKAVICASTGNTAASAAAYAARAGMESIVLVPHGNVAIGKLAGAVAYGARVVTIEGSFDDALDLVREIVARENLTLVNSVNPVRLEGQKTAAWEVVDSMGGPPDWLCLPVGNAGNINAYWQGFQEDGFAPRILGAQAAGSAPIVRNQRVMNPSTIATAIRVGNPARWEQANEVLRQSNGKIVAVEDEEILDAYHLVATMEGVFCEPSSAAGLAAIRQQVGLGQLDLAGKTVVAVLTGHGMKDPEAAIGRAALPDPIQPTADELSKALSR